MRMLLVFVLAVLLPLCACVAVGCMLSIATHHHTIELQALGASASALFGFVVRMLLERED